MTHKLFILVALSLVGHLTLAQVDSSSSATDTSSRSWMNADTVKVKSKAHSPTKATLYSLVLPGLGQAYNHQYWKIGVIYGIGGFFVTQIVSNHHDWVQAKNDLDTRVENQNDTAYGKPSFSGEYDYYDAKDPHHDPNVRTYSTENLTTIRDGYRRDRDFYIIMTTLLYTLNLVDAAVFAHLREFEVSEKLSMRFDPQIRFVYGANMPVAGLSCSLHFK